MTLTEFLAARVDEDETAALAASRQDRWVATTRGFVGTSGQVRYANPTEPVHRGVVAETGPYANAVHIARHDPARVLVYVAAVRRVLSAANLYRAYSEQEHRSEEEQDLMRGHVLTLMDALRGFAAQYADHPDFDPAWSAT